MSTEGTVGKSICRFPEKESKKFPFIQDLLFGRWIGGYVGRSRTVLDLGCGKKWYHQFMRRAELVVTVDVWPGAEPDILMDIGTDPLPFSNKTFETVLMLDVIEHMERDHGAFALREAMRVCAGRLLLLTPLIWDDNRILTDDPESPYFGNERNIHLSLWTEEDFQELNGWKKIEGIMPPNYYLGQWMRT